MTRINTNVSSLNAQKTLARSNASLQESLTRLSTGLRINSGKDDPAGLIASEVLRSDITSTERAISNSVRANQVIATADSALGQISSLLNDIRGLVVEAANSGAMSADQIAANQLQVDSSLEAINRISQTTSFQGRKLLDGSMGFVTDSVDTSLLTDVEIDQANFGTLSQIDVNVEVAAQAEKAALTYEGGQLTQDTVIEVGGSDGFEAFSFDAGSTVTEMRDAINLVSDALGISASLADRVAETATAGEAEYRLAGSTNNSFTIQAATAGESSGDFTIRFALGADATTASNTATWNAGDPNVIDITVAADQWTATVTNATVDMVANFGATTDGANGDDTLAITAKQAGIQFNGLKFTIASITAATASATYDYATNEITVNITNAADDVSDLGTLLDNELGELFTFTWANGGDDTAIASTGTVTYTNATAGVDGGVVNSTNGTLANIADEIDDLTEINAITVSGSGVLEMITSSGTIGSINSTDDASADDDPNSLVQLSGTEKADNLDITFSAAGAKQSFSITTTDNTRTNGYSTGYLTSTVDDQDAVLKVVYSAEQGQQWDDITITITNDANDKSVVWDPENKALTVFNAVASATANDLRDQINAALAGTFTASVVGSDGANGLFTTGDSTTTADGKIYDSITVNLATDENGVVTTTAAQAIDAINASSVFTDLDIAASNGFSSDGSGRMEAGTLSMDQLGVTATDAAASGTTAAVNGDAAQITVTALTDGAAYDNVKVVFSEDSGVAQNGGEYATYDSTNKVLTFTVNPDSTAAEVVTNWAQNWQSTAAAALFSAALTGTGTSKVDANDIGYLSGGITYSGTSTGGLQAEGNFDADDVVGTGNLTIESNTYGSEEFVSVKSLTGAFATVDADGETEERDYGADAVVRINGQGAVTSGLDVSLNTSVLDVSFTLDSSFTIGSSTSFSITSGGAKFQLGPEVVSTQQARIAIQSMSTAVLGGKSGRLFQLRSGAIYDLSTDATSAAKVVDEAISKVVGLRGRLGAFQRTTLDTNIAALSDTLESLMEAESNIRDTDFASESAALTRAQILVQSGLTVLGIANQNPQSVLSLLR